jgi:predicted nucleic acid-binding protein
MSGDDGGERTVLVDASVFISLAATHSVGLLVGLEGGLVIPAAVAEEITDEPATGALASLRDAGDVRIVEASERTADAQTYLGVEEASNTSGDAALLSVALDRASTVLVSDDKPLRKTCKALSIPVSGSIGVLIRAVERGDIGAEEANDKLYAMDEVGARLSASLVRKAERLIEEAAGEA